MVKLVATDIDGTLLRTDGTVSDRTRRVVAQTEEAGTYFVLVTGRPPRWLAPVRDQMDHHGLAICANGGIVMDLATEEVIEVNAFADDVAREVLTRMRTLTTGLGFGVEWADGFVHDRAYPRGVRRSELAPGAALDALTDDDFFTRPVIKLLVRSIDGPLDVLAEEAVALTDGLATVTWSSTGLLEISASGVHKASTLERFAAERDIAPEEVVAFGDMPNDLHMLDWAGRGIAVANAHPLVLETADETTASNDEDGVAVVLESLLDA
jgi:Cof subfamily protein (haloacid dehalogenase superfamily)